MITVSNVVVFVAAALVTLLASPVVRALLGRAQVLDVPNARSMHNVPIVRGGGVAVALGALVAVASSSRSHQLVAVVVVALSLGAVGLVDDWRGLTARTRLIAQFAIPAAAMPALMLGMPITAVWSWCFGAGAVLWCTSFANAFNFMDGINGMAVAQTVVAGVSLAVVNNGRGDGAAVALGLAIAGAAIGFAPYNVVSAKLFLGDVGAYFIGVWLALVCIIAIRDGVPPEVVVAPYLLYLLDTSTTLIRRWLRGARLTEAHREHAYQRLVQQGWKHSTTAGLAGGSMLISSGVMIGVADAAPGIRAGAFVVALAAAAIFVLLPQAHARRSVGTA